MESSHTNEEDHRNTEDMSMLLLDSSDSEQQHSHENHAHTIIHDQVHHGLHASSYMYNDALKAHSDHYDANLRQHIMQQMEDNREHENGILNDEHDDNANGKAQAIPLQPYGSISVQQLLQFQQQVALMQMYTLQQQQGNSSPGNSNSANAIPAMTISVPNLIQPHSVPPHLYVNPQHLVVSPSVPPFTPIGIEPTSGHYIVIPAPYNAVLYPPYTYPPGTSPTTQSSYPVPAMPYRTSTSRRRRTMKKKSEVNDDKKETEGVTSSEDKKKNPSDIKCLDLKIGNYNKTVLRNESGQYVWTVIAKFYYGKKAIAYEISEIDLNKPEKTLEMRYKIEYRFSSIGGLAFIEDSDDTVKLIVDLREPPQFAEKAKGTGATTTWKKRSDFTPGAQASLYRRHTLTFEKKDIEKPKILLLQSSDEIATLASTHSLIPSDHDHDLKFPVGFVEVSDPMSPSKKKQKSTEDNCKCTGGCNSNRCACARTFRQCSDSCKCKSCRNPLNVLQRALNTSNLNRFADDYCLKDNLLKIKVMDDILKQEVKGNCSCGTFNVKLSDCLPKYVCHSCGATYTYSWCLNALFDEDQTIRHCKDCKECKRFPSIHCYTCGKCYHANGSRICPDCNNPSPLDWDQDRSDPIEEENEANETELEDL